MATLVDEGLFKYLDNLKKEVNERRKDYASEDTLRFPDSLQSLVHSQMQKVIDAEKRFLKYQSSNSNTQAMFYVSQTTGLPSVDSLKPDLENMCELTKEEPSFKEIAEEYKRGVEIKDKKKFKKAYKKVSKKEWRSKLSSYDQGNLDSKIGFDFSDSNNGNFEIILKESLYIKGNDKYCKEFPVFTREGRMRYCYVLNSLLSEFEEGHYILNPPAIQKFKKDALAKKVRNLEVLEGVGRSYGFSTNKNLKVLGKGVKDCCYATGKFTRSTIAATAAYFIIPSFYRFLAEDSEKKYLGESDNGIGFGSFVGTVSLVASTICSPILGLTLSMDTLHILAIPIIPNLLSGTYEIGRALCHDANKRWQESKKTLIAGAPRKALRDSND